MSHFQDYRIPWEGKPAIAHAHVDTPGGVQVSWLDVGNGPETHIDREPRNTYDETVAFSAWSREKRERLYTAVRNELR